MESFRISTELPFPARSPIRVFGLVLLLVFSAEGGIMLLLPRLPDDARGTAAQSLIDAGVLTLVLAPAIWLMTVVPLRRLFHVRGVLLRKLLKAQEQERARIARDLHDSVGQNLTALLVGLRTIEQAANFDTARARARNLRALAADAHSEVRRLAHGLRPLVLEDLGLVAALHRLCQDFERTHAISVELRCELFSCHAVVPEMQTALYRIVQESLANIARHARASKVVLHIQQSDASIGMTIRDDGRGFDASAAHSEVRGELGFGMHSIRERALMLGGECTVRARPGAGTTIEIRIPVPGPS